MDKDCVIKTVRRDLQSWYAKRRGREDPNRRIGSKEYEKGDSFLALDEINIEIKRGERVGIIGANGAGKSTFLKLLSRITSPTSGTIAFRGRIASMLEVGTGFHPELTGRENIYLNGAILGMNREEVSGKIDEIIEFSECEQFIDTPVKRYSSGMFVKLAFSVAAHLDAEILIMDEARGGRHEIPAQVYQKDARACRNRKPYGALCIAQYEHDPGFVQPMCGA